VEVLMGRYGDSVGARKAGRLNLFGGKIGADESAAATATRLMWEECGRLFDRQSLLQRVERSDVVWLPGSRYALHLVELVSDSELAICELYAAAPSAVRADSVHASHPLQGQYAGRERRAMIDDSAVRSPRVQDLHWIELPTLLRFLATQPRLMSKAGCNDLLTTATGLQCPVVDFAVCTMNAVKVQKRLTQLQQQQPQQQQQQHGTAAHSPSVQHAVIDASPMGVAGVTHSRPDGAAAAPHDHSSNASSRGRRRRTHQQSHADVAPAAAPSSSSSTSTAFAPADVDDEWARARARAQAARAQRLARV
jgi:8-oxo-dGTP pyrophosphatase MutT (NUDIX family)